MKHVHEEEPPLAPDVMASLRDPVLDPALRSRTVRALREAGVFDGRLPESRARVGLRAPSVVQAIAATLIFAAGLGLGSWNASRTPGHGSTGSSQAPAAAKPATARIQEAAQSYVDALTLANADSGAARTAAVTSFRTVVDQMNRVIALDQPPGAAAYAVSNAPSSARGERARSGGAPMVLTLGYRARVLAGLVTVVGMGAGIANAQCAANQRVPDFGYQFVSCVGCLGEYVRHEVAEPGYMVEPVVRQVRAAGPAAGLLMNDDSLVAVDGIDIHTRDAAVRLTNASQPTRFTFRRAGSVGEVTITPRSTCSFEINLQNIESAVHAFSARDSARRLVVQFADSGRMGVGGTVTRMGVVTLPPTPGSQGGWLGLGLRADSATASGAFVVAPLVERIDPGSPAARAGLSIGLRLYSVDGQSLRSAGGARRLNSIRPGDRVVLTLHGDHGWVEQALTAERAPPAVLMQALRNLSGSITVSRDTTSGALQQLRFTVDKVMQLIAAGQHTAWTVGGLDVETRGPGVTIIRDSTNDVLTIYAGADTIVVRRRPPSGPAGSARKGGGGDPPQGNPLPPAER